MSKDSDSGGDIGYMKPPKHSQFKPGQSGNPRGRPSGAKNTATMLKEILLEKVTVTQGGRKTRMSRLEIMIRATVRQAVQGNNRAYNNVTRWADYCGLVIAEEPPISRRRGGVVRYSEIEAYVRELDGDAAGAADDRWE